MANNFSKSKNKILGDVMKKNKDSNTKVIKNISLDLIDENPKNAEIFNMDEIEHLAKVIEEEGFSGAIEVVEKAKGRYQISSGHRRYRAMKLLNRDTIPCIIEGNFSDTLLRRKLLSSNIHNRKMRPMDWARSIKEYRDILTAEKFKGDKRAEISNFFGIAESNVTRYESLNKLNSRLQKMVDEPEFPFTALDKVHEMTKDQQTALADRIDYYRENHPNLGISRAIITQYIEAILSEESEKQRIQERRERKNTEPTYIELSSIRENEETEIDYDIGTERKSTRQIKKEIEEEIINNIDFDVIRFSKSLYIDVNKDFTVSKSKEIKDAIKNLEKAIEIIKEKIY